MLHESSNTEAKKTVNPFRGSFITTAQIYKLNYCIYCGKCPFVMFTDFPPGIILIKNMISCEMRTVNEANKEDPGSKASVVTYGHFP